jgi:hypothetical protein
MAGSYPIKTIKEILRLLDSAEANARNKGMLAPYIIKHILANDGGLQWHYGRQRRQRRKNTNLEIILIEKEPGKRQEKTKKKTEIKKQEPIKNNKKNKTGKDEKALPKEKNDRKTDNEEKNK